MTIRSEPLKDGRTVAPSAPNTGAIALAIVLLVFGAIGWLAGGKYTIEGWVVALNMFARWIGVDGQLATPRGWVLIIAIVLSALIYSKVETLALKRGMQRLPAFWIGWALIVITDIASTLLGVLNPPVGSMPVLIQLAQIVPLAILWSLILTFVPEWIILSAWRLIRR